MISNDTDEPFYLYSTALLIRHPALPASRITDELDEEPAYAWTVGDEVRIGDRVLEGRPPRAQTVWCIKEEREGKRHFFCDVAAFCDRLQSKSCFSKKFVILADPLF